MLKHLGRELAKYGKKVLLTYGGGSIKKSGLYDTVVSKVKEAGLELFELSGVDPNPKIQSIRDGQKLCKEQGIDMVLAVGGVVLAYATYPYFRGPVPFAFYEVGAAVLPVLIAADYVLAYRLFRRMQLVGRKWINI